MTTRVQAKMHPEAEKCWTAQHTCATVFVARGVVARLVVSALVSDDEFTDVPKLANQLEPMSARWVPATSVSEFGDVARELRDEVDEDARKAATP